VPTISQHRYFEWWASGACHRARIRATRWLCHPTIYSTFSPRIAAHLLRTFADAEFEKLGVLLLDRRQEFDDRSLNPRAQLRRQAFEGFPERKASLANCF
jgi:hypothetical protein